MSGHTETHHHPAPNHVEPAAIAEHELTRVGEFKFFFKKKKDSAEPKKPTIVLKAPIPTFHGLLEQMADEKVSKLVLDLVEDAIKDQIKDLIADENISKQEDLDLSRLTLEYIANIPRSERAGSSIPKEVWEAFEKDYIEVMTPIRAREMGTDEKEAAEKAAKAARVFLSKWNLVKSDKKVINFLQKQLVVWGEATEQLEEFAEIYKFLDERATLLQSKDTEITLAALQ